MSGNARNTLRLLLQLAAVALVVAVPWLLHQRLLADTFVTQDWVTHTAETKTRVSAAQAAVRDGDRALLWLALYPEQGMLADQLQQSQARVYAELSELVRLTDDDPEQKARVAQMQALVEARVSDADRVLALLSEGELETARQLLGIPGTMSQLRSITEALIAEEDRLMLHRRQQAEHDRRRFVWIATGFAALQLILLALIVGLSERQHRRRAQLEVQSREANRRADLILQAVRKPIALLSHDLCILLCNPAFQSLYGDENQDLSSRSLTEIGDGAWNDAGLVQKLYDVCHLGRELWDHELIQNTPAAGRRVLLVNARRTPGEEPRSATLILTANDVTATRNAERQVRELNEQLSERVEEVSEANRELEGFSYSVSHDLRAPLRHIAAFALKLERALELPEDGKPAHYLRVIGDSAQRMGLLIDELLVHTRLGRGNVSIAPVAMGPLVDEVRTMLEADAPGRSIRWRIAPLPTVAGDANTLRLLWQNLLGNAVKYTAGRETAVIDIEVHRDADRREYEFVVGDNGAGFDMAYADKLFGVFQRLHSAAEFPGTGIGLANVRRIVTRHGGKVWAEAEPDRGARFHFTLPDRAPSPGETDQ